MKTRIMYIESRAEGLIGAARIGRVSFSKTGKTLHYGGMSFQKAEGPAIKANFVELQSGDLYWISGPRRDGQDRLHAGHVPIEIDDDVREEYWTEIRGLPSRKDRRHA